MGNRGLDSGFRWRRGVFGVAGGRRASLPFYRAGEGRLQFHRSRYIVSDQAGQDCTWRDIEGGDLTGLDCRRKRVCLVPRATRHLRCQAPRDSKLGKPANLPSVLAPLMSCRSLDLGLSYRQALASQRSTVQTLSNVRLLRRIAPEKAK